MLGKHGGSGAESLRHGLEALGLSVVDFTAADAALVADMSMPTRRLGLGLADRACLALASTCRS